MYHFESPLVEVFYSFDDFALSLFATQHFPLAHTFNCSTFFSANHSNIKPLRRIFRHFQQNLNNLKRKIYGQIMCRYYRIDSKTISSDAVNARFQVLIGVCFFFYPLAWHKVDEWVSVCFFVVIRLLSNDCILLIEWQCSIIFYAIEKW